MSLTLTRTIRMIISALIAGMMGAGAIVLGNMTAEGALKPGAEIIALVTGVMLALKDVQAYLSNSPVTVEPSDTASANKRS